MKTPRILVSALVLAAGLAGCSISAPAPADPGSQPDPTTPVASTDCPEPQGGAWGPSVMLEGGSELLGTVDLPADACAYGSDSGVATWLEGYGWASEDRGTWDDGDARNLAFLPPAGSDIVVAFAHDFTAFSESVSMNIGLSLDFLREYDGLEVGDELAVFYAWR